MTPTVMIWGTNKYEISDLLYQIWGGTTNEPDPWVLLQIGRKCIGWVQGWVRPHQVDRKVRCARRQVDRKGQPYYTRPLRHGAAARASARVGATRRQGEPATRLTARVNPTIHVITLLSNL